MTGVCPGCGESVAFSVYACRVDWARLPRPYQRAINAAWRRRLDGRPGADEAHEAAKAAATAWLRANPR